MKLFHHLLPLMMKYFPLIFNVSSYPLLYFCGFVQKEGVLTLAIFLLGYSEVGNLNIQLEFSGSLLTWKGAYLLITERCDGRVLIIFGVSQGWLWDIRQVLNIFRLIFSSLK